MKVIDIPGYDLHMKLFTSKLSLKRYTNKKNYQLSHDLNTVNGLAMVFEDKGVDILLLLPKEYSEEIMDHELIHITWFVARIIDLPLNFTNQEFQAYLFPAIKRELKKVYGK